MKRGCKNGRFGVEDQVYFVIIVDDKPYAVKYKILEKIECIQGFGYVIDVVREQDDPGLTELVSQKKVGTNFRICGDSLFKNKADAIKKARGYFQNIVQQLDLIAN